MSKKGTGTFVLQRASAVVLLPFVIWFMWSLAAHAGESYQGMVEWLRQPFNKIMFGGLVTVGAFHMRIGLGEVIDDYIHGWLGNVLSMFNLLIAIGVVALTWYSLFSI